MRMRCIIVDDEALALDLLEDNVRKVPFLELAGKCSNAFEAMEILQKEEIDLLFLDIHMPDLSGIQFLKSLSRKPLVIFTTAYEQYALQGFELDAVDYLLKPFPFERFLKAAGKALEIFSHKGKPLQEEPKVKNETAASFFFVKADYKLVKVVIADILYVEGLKDYVRIFLAGKTVTTLMSMKEISGKLPGDSFRRVHRSYIVNVRRIEFIQRNFLRIGNKDIPVGDSYKESLNDFIQP